MFGARKIGYIPCKMSFGIPFSTTVRFPSPEFIKKSHTVFISGYRIVKLENWTQRKTQYKRITKESTSSNYDYLLQILYYSSVKAKIFLTFLFQHQCRLMPLVQSLYIYHPSHALRTNSRRQVLPLFADI